MKRVKTLGFQLKTTVNMMERKMNNVIMSNGDEDMTPMHGMILEFLICSQDREICQRDVEAEFNITRSTVTSILKLMEKKGYILRRGVDYDARLKCITLTPLGVELHQRVDFSIRQMEEILSTSLTEEEFQQLMILLDKVKSVL